MTTITIGHPATVALEEGRIVVHRYEVCGTGQTVHCAYVREDLPLFDADAEGGRYSSHTHFEDPDGRAVLYGELTSYFPEQRFAHLAAMSEERSRAVRAYWRELEEQAIRYIWQAYPYTKTCPVTWYSGGEIIMQTADIASIEGRS